MFLISYHDIKERKIYNSILVFLILFRFCFWMFQFVFFQADVSVKEDILAAVIAFCFFLCMKLANSSGVGMGDVKLVFVLGLYLGGLIFYVILVSMTALVLFPVFLKRKKQTELPYAPFLLLAMLIVNFCR